MPTKNQHFVPRIYLKAWETKVETSKEPNKKFDGVYYYTNGMDNGEGSTREAILWEPHLYTISFRQFYLARKCPKVYNYFVDEIYNSMRSNSPKPVYGKLLSRQKRAFTSICLISINGIFIMMMEQQQERKHY